MGWVLGAAVVLVLFVGPLLVGGLGYLRSRRAPAAGAASWNWRLTAASALIHAIAFNLIFFVQELFLVVPKALTPGLRPTLFHNNHSWTGEHPLASLFQGTGALAIFLTGIGCALLLRGGAGRTIDGRLFLIWMAYNGLFQSLPQVVVGAVNPGNDVGMAMDYLRLGPVARTLAALLALAAIPPTALWLARRFLDLAGGQPRGRFLFRAVTLPALIAIPLIVLFRVPREPIEVLLPPVLVAWIGIAWIQALAWRLAADPVPHPPPAVVAPALLLLALLLVFQLVLRPGVAF